MLLLTVATSVKHSTEWRVLCGLWPHLRADWWVTHYGTYRTKTALSEAHYAMSCEEMRVMRTGNICHYG